MASRHSIPLPYLLPSLLFLIAVILFPLIYGFYLSFTDLSFRVPESGRLIGLGNYLSLFSDVDCQHSLVRTMYFVAISITTTLLIGVGLSFLFYFYNPIGSSLFRTLFLIPITIPPVVIGLNFRFMLTPEIGVVSYIINSFLGYKIDFFSPELALTTIALVDAWQWSPFVFAIYLTALEGLPKGPIEAAQLDGASKRQLISNIILPMTKPILLAMGIIRLMDSLREFDKVYVMTKGGPGSASEIINLYIWKVGLSWLDIARAVAMAIILLFVIELLSTIILRMFKGGGG